MNQTTKPCPFCAEEVLSIAVKCKHCKANLAASLPALTAQQTPSPSPVSEKTECPKCGMSVPVYIKTCPHCQMDMNPGCFKTTAGCIVGIIGLLILLGGLAMVISSWFN